MRYSTLVCCVLVQFDSGSIDWLSWDGYRYFRRREAIRRVIQIMLGPPPAPADRCTICGEPLNRSELRHKVTAHFSCIVRTTFEKESEVRE